MKNIMYFQIKYSYLYLLHHPSVFGKNTATGANKIFLIDYGLVKPFRVSTKRYLKIFEQFGDSNRWEVKLDNETKKIYYIDHIEKNSQWEQPKNIFAILPDGTKRFENATAPTAKPTSQGTNGLHHIPYRADKDLVGTIRFCSINANAGCEQSPRDDLEGLAYTLIYLAKGSLPWQKYPGIHKDMPKERYEKILNIKKETKVEDLCSGLPKEFEEFLNYCRKLEFEEKPDYEMLVKKFEPLVEDADKATIWPEFDQRDSSE